MSTEICPNCCEELTTKKYNSISKIKCLACGYETSQWIEEQERIETLTRIDEERNKEKRKNDEV